jgi:hypothetical protein
MSGSLRSGLRTYRGHMACGSYVRHLEVRWRYTSTSPQQQPIAMRGWVDEQNGLGWRS